jgi:hypothetical protein
VKASPAVRRVAPLIVLFLAVLVPLGATDAIARAFGGSRPPPSADPCPSTTPAPSLAPTPAPSPSPSSAPSPSITQDASALTDATPTPEPSPSPTPEPSPSSEPEPSPSPAADPCPSARSWPPRPPSFSPTPQPDPSPGPDEGPQATGTPGAETGDLYRGTYSTERLVAAAEVLRGEGWSEEEIRRQVFSPFIVVGPASWSDSWGAPRFGPGSTVRTHEGQDVLCAYGADVLAPEERTIEFGTGLLGGRVARLHRPAGGYWYFAHLSDWNLKTYSNGDPVHTGDVIGYCGETGNATVPHVHFGHYRPDGEAIDPMGSLVSWLHEAERHLGQLVSGGLTRIPDTTATAAPLSPPTPVETPPLLLSLEGEDTNASTAIAASAPVIHAFLAAEERDGAFALTLIWVAGISFGLAGRRLGQLVVARRRDRSHDAGVAL